jgi:hypothetical protein
MFSIFDIDPSDEHVDVDHALYYLASCELNLFIESWQVSSLSILSSEWACIRNCPIFSIVPGSGSIDVSFKMLCQPKPSEAIVVVKSRRLLP